MALQSVKFTLNGQTYDLTLDGATGQYKATITAPAESSWGAAEDHKYHGTVEAKDLAGNTAQATVTQFPGLGLRVLEKTKPTISVTYPTNGAYIPSSQPTITWTVLDDGSGIDPDTIQISVDSGAATADGIQTEATEGGYTCSYTPATALGDGPHTFRFTVSDHDGNASDAATVAVTVDTVPPTLNVTAPAEGLVTNQGALTVQGITNDEASSPVTVKVQVGSGEPVAATVDVEGNFQAQVTLSEGANAITVTATDAAGKSTTVTRNVTVDTVPPAITAVTLAPNPVDAGQTYVITVTVSDRWLPGCGGPARGRTCSFPRRRMAGGPAGCRPPLRGPTPCSCGRKTWRGMWATWPPSGWPLTRRGCAAGWRSWPSEACATMTPWPGCWGRTPLRRRPERTRCAPLPQRTPCGPKLWDL